jgi:hypothetical protein
MVFLIYDFDAWILLEKKITLIVNLQLCIIVIIDNIKM